MFDELTVGGLRRAYLAGEVSCVDVVTEYAERVERARGAGDHAGIVAFNVHAFEAAEKLDWQLRRRGCPVGPLHGVPIVVKDLFETADVPTTFGSRVVCAESAHADAVAVARLRAAGAVVLAKATTADFGMSLFSRSSLSGFTTNPYDRSRDAGGSSGGCAAAVSADLCVAGLGSDSSGSVRLPASFTGLVGLRPTVGLVSVAGASPVLWNQDTAGPMTRCVRDAAVMLDAMTARPIGAGDAMPGRGHDLVTLRGIRIGVLGCPVRNDLGSDAMEVEVLVDRAIADLARLRATLVPMTVRTGRRIHGAAAAPVIRRELERFLAARPHLGVGVDDVTVGDGADLLGLLEAGPADPDTVTAVLEDRVQRRQDLVASMRVHRVDAVCYPTAMLPAPRIVDLESGRWTSRTFPALTWLAARAGAPAITVPAGTTASGLPVGVEFVGAPFTDRVLLSIASRYEQATRQRRAPVS